MNPSILSKFVRVLSTAAAIALLHAGVVSAGPAQIVIVNINAPGVGFNDPTPRAPVGGNTGTTLGAAAADRLPVRREPLERDPRQHRADSHPRAVRGARRQRSWQRRPDRTSPGLHQRPAGRDVVPRRAGEQAGGFDL